MYAAWCIIGSVERAVATNLDYDEFHNYWPNIEFTILVGTTKSSTGYQSSRITTNHLSSEWLLLWGSLLGRNL
jgi:hypothetical protein